MPLFEGFCAVLGVTDHLHIQCLKSIAAHQQQICDSMQTVAINARTKAQVTSFNKLGQFEQGDGLIVVPSQF